MKLSGKRDPGHSIFQRLLNHARIAKEDFNFILIRYGIERFLYRLSTSSYAETFILKGASLFLIWQGRNYRVTKDADLLSIQSMNHERITEIFKEICQKSSLEIDGMKYLPETIKVMPIREEHGYAGMRVTFMGFLHQARIHLQVDIGMGDPITPAPERATYPTLLDLPAPELLTYTPYSVIAEKLEAMVHLGMANSRMKDFYDIWLLSNLFEFEGKTMSEAIRSTFQRRSTPLPDGLPTAITDEFTTDKQKQWEGFLRKLQPEAAPDNLVIVMARIEEFIMPIFVALRENRSLEMHWDVSGKWIE